MYITESIKEVTPGVVDIVLIWKTDADIFPFNPKRYRNNVQIAGFGADTFKYRRRGEFLVGSHAGQASGYPRGYMGIGEWRIDPKIRGNVRGCC